MLPPRQQSAVKQFVLKKTALGKTSGSNGKNMNLGKTGPHHRHQKSSIGFRSLPPFCAIAQSQRLFVFLTALAILIMHDPPIVLRPIAKAKRIALMRELGSFSRNP